MGSPLGIRTRPASPAITLALLSAALFSVGTPASGSASNPTRSELNLEACYLALASYAPGLQGMIKRKWNPIKFLVPLDVPSHFRQGLRVPEPFHLQLAISGIFRGIDLFTPFNQQRLTEEEQLHFPLVRTFTRFHRPMSGRQIELRATPVAFERELGSRTDPRSRILMEFALTQPSGEPFTSGFLFLSVWNGTEGSAMLPSDRDGVFFTQDGQPYVDWNLKQLVRPDDDKDYLELVSAQQRSVGEEVLRELSLRSRFMRETVPVLFNYKDAYNEVSASMYLSMVLSAFENHRERLGFTDQWLGARELLFEVQSSSVQHIRPLKYPSTVDVEMRVVALNPEMTKLVLSFKVIRAALGDPEVFATGYLMLSPKKSSVSRLIQLGEAGEPVWAGPPISLPVEARPIFFESKFSPSAPR